MQGILWVLIGIKSYNHYKLPCIMLCILMWGTVSIYTKVRATVLLTHIATNQRMLHHASASRTAVWLVTSRVVWLCVFIKVYEWTGPPTLQTLWAYNALKGKVAHTLVEHSGISKENAKLPRAAIEYTNVFHRAQETCKLASSMSIY